MRCLRYRIVSLPASEATTKVLSMNHFDISGLPQSLRSWARTSSLCSSVPLQTKRWKGRWHIWYEGYRSGRSAHCAMVREMQELHPRTSACLDITPIRDSTTYRCASVRPFPLHPLFRESLPPIYEAVPNYCLDTREYHANCP